MDVIAVPLHDPASAALIHREPLAGPTDPAVRTGCHDVGVILGDVNMAACASADTINVWDISDPRDPDLLFTITEPGVGRIVPTASHPCAGNAIRVRLGDWREELGRWPRFAPQR